MLDVSFGLLHLSLILIVSIFIFIIRMKNKKQIHYAFLSLILAIFIWSLGFLLEIYTRKFFGQTIMFFVYFWFLGLCFVPLAILFVGQIYAKNRIKMTYKQLLLIIIPIIDYMVIITNKYHNLFLQRI